MNVGDLVIMPGESLMAGDDMSVGIIMADDYQARNQRQKNNRIGVMWVDGEGMIDYEPRDWLLVISEVTKKNNNTEDE
jgi:hypothetical protein